jgi:hypothetical protein
LPFATPVKPNPEARLELRPLSPFETFMWLMDSHSPSHATLAIRVSGQTSIDGWRMALDKTRRSHPLWSAVITEGDDGCPLFEDMKSPHVAFRVVRGDFESHWENEYATDVGTPINPACGPLVRATLLYTEASSMLILGAHHSICDGMSLAFALRDVVRALSGHELEKYAPPISLEERLDLPALPYKVTRPSDYGTSNSTSSIFRVRTKSMPKVQSLKLSREVTDRIRDRARTEQTSVHGALIAATAIAARKHPTYRPSRDLRVCSTVNDRKLLDSPEDFCMYFTAFVDLFPDEVVSSFWDLARAAKAHLRASQDVAGVRALLKVVRDDTALALSADESAERPGRLFLYDIHLSNLGVVPIEPSYGHLSVESIWGPGVLVGFEGEQTLGVSTMNGSLCLLHTSHSALPAFLTDIQEVLRANL